LFAAGVVDTGGKFAAGIVGNLEMTQALFSGAWGKMIHEKNLEQKIS
jgi:hypothetical protein